MLIAVSRLIILMLTCTPFPRIPLSLMSYPHDRLLPLPPVSPILEKKYEAEQSIPMPVHEGKDVNGHVLLMCWPLLFGAESEQMRPRTRAVTWNGIPYVTVYNNILYSMFNGMVYATLHLQV